MQSAGTPRTILLVEDVEPLRRLLRTVLTKEGFRVIEACDGARALEVASTYAESIDLLLSDVLMPNVNGPALASRLLRERQGTKVLFISGYPERTMLLANNPEFVLLQKPFTPDALIAAVRQVLAPVEPK
jgi:two-component system cell cycle sensor histidine kinase/response regulator CckA